MGARRGLILPQRGSAGEGRESEGGETAGDQTGARHRRGVQRYSALTIGVGHLLGVAEQHHRVVAEEQLVLDAGVARAHAALDEQHGLGLLDVEDRHAEDRRLRVGLGGRVGDVVGADDKGDVGLGELGVDVLELEHLVVGHVGLGQQHVHVAGHAAGDRMDRVFDLDALLLQHVGHFAQRVLGLRHRHAVAGHDDDLGGVLHHEGGVVGRALLDRPRLLAGRPGPRPRRRSRRG